MLGRLCLLIQLFLVTIISYHNDNVTASASEIKKVVLSLTDEGMIDLSSIDEDEKRNLIAFAQDIIAASDNIDLVKSPQQNNTKSSSSSSSHESKLSSQKHEFLDAEKINKQKPNVRSGTGRNLQYYNNRRNFYGRARNNNYGGASTRSGRSRPALIITRPSKPSSSSSTASSGSSGSSGGIKESSTNAGNTGSSSSRTESTESGPSGYSYGKGNCPDKGSTGLACPPENLGAICDRFNNDNNVANFNACYEVCKPSFCCIHDAVNTKWAPSCRTDENCQLYAYCYIIWWKLSDTYGPAIYLRVKEDASDPFYAQIPSEFTGNLPDNEFTRQLIYHHLDNFNDPINANTAKTIFDNPDYWMDGKEGGDFVVVDTSTWPAKTYT